MLRRHIPSLWCGGDRAGEIVALFCEATAKKASGGRAQGEGRRVAVRAPQPRSHRAGGVQDVLAGGGGRRPEDRLQLGAGLNTPTHRHTVVARSGATAAICRAGQSIYTHWTHSGFAGLSGGHLRAHRRQPGDHRLAHRRVGLGAEINTVLACSCSRGSPQGVQLQAVTLTCATPSRAHQPSAAAAVAAAAAAAGSNGPAPAPRPPAAAASPARCRVSRRVS